MRDDQLGTEGERSSDLPEVPPNRIGRIQKLSAESRRSNGLGKALSEAGSRERHGMTTASLAPPEAAQLIETIVSPFHCLYNDASLFIRRAGSRSFRRRGESPGEGLVAPLRFGAEALVHQAAEELGRPELRGLLADPSRPLPLAEAWRLLPAIVLEPEGPVSSRPFEPESPPWPQFVELLMLRTSWSYPGEPANHRALPGGSRWSV